MPSSHVVCAALFFFALLSSRDANAQACTAKGKQMVTAAQALFANGRTSEAVTQLESAADLCPNSCPLFLAIADAYSQMSLATRSEQYLGYARKLGCNVSSKLDTKGSSGDSPENDDNRKSYVRQKWALVVGIDRFQHDEKDSGDQSPKWQLQYSAKDARDFADLLKDPQLGRFTPATVVLLTDREATSDRIRTEINNIARLATPDDLVVLFFSTHGMPAEADLASDEGKTGYIVTHNTDAENLYGTAYSMHELDEVIRLRLRARRVITFLDTCYSGGVLRGGKALKLNLAQDAIAAQIAQGKGRVVITSSRSTEESWECEQYHNGCFTYQLLQAMKQRDGLSTISDIYRQLQLGVPDLVMRTKNKPQNPMMKPDTGKIDIVIGTPVQ